MNYASLIPYGWNDYWQAQSAEYLEQGWLPARVIAEGTHVYRLATVHGEVFASISGKYRYLANRREDYPSVGDWVALEYHNSNDHSLIHALMPRRTCFQRKMAGTVIDSQIVASNMDTVWLVMSVNDINLRRLERYLIATWESGATPVVILSKADLIANPQEVLEKVQPVCQNIAVYLVSVETGEGMDQLIPYCSDGQTVSLLGASGAGKSTLVNYMLKQQVQSVSDVREEDLRGRHTTTQRNLFCVEYGGAVIDTPGMRELQLWHQESGMDDAFQDILDLSEACAFRDCQHETEPDCAIRHALQNGTLDAERFSNFKKMKRELKYIALKEDKGAQAAQKEKWKKMTKAMRKR